MGPAQRERAFLRVAEAAADASFHIFRAEEKQRGCLLTMSGATWRRTTLRSLVRTRCAPHVLISAGTGGCFRHCSVSRSPAERSSPKRQSRGARRDVRLPGRTWHDRRWVGSAGRSSCLSCRRSRTRELDRAPRKDLPCPPGSCPTRQRGRHRHWMGSRKKLVESCGGRVEVFSEPEQGTRFGFVRPTEVV